MKTKKSIRIIAWILICLSLITGGLSYLFWPTDWSWPNFFLSISVALFQLFLGILLVNIYITESEKKVRARQCLSLIHDSIAAYHGRYLKLLRTRFKSDVELQEVLEAFMKNDCNPDVVSDESIKEFIEAIRPEYSELLKEVSLCVDKLNMASSSGLFGSNAQDLYQYNICVRAGNELLKLKSIEPNNHKDIFEKAVKFDLYTQYLRRQVIINGDLSKKID